MAIQELSMNARRVERLRVKRDRLAAECEQLAKAVTEFEDKHPDLRDRSRWREIDRIRNGPQIVRLAELERKRAEVGRLDAALEREGQP